LTTAILEMKRGTKMEKHKILIVDDDPDLRRGLNLRLRASHFDTAYATDGFSAIAMAQKERPDLIILDIGLPAGDGFVVLDRLQQSAQLSSIPVIVLTARDPQYNRDRTLKAGACAFLQKPADNNVLMTTIRFALNPPWPGTTVAAPSP
jgi:DNA-binding response OmpR family regulator